MRSLNSEVLALIATKAIRIEYFYTGVFSGATLRLWTGIGDLTIDGETYLGNGWLLGIGGIKEVLASQAQGIVIALSGIPANILALVLNESSSSVSGSLKIGWFDEVDTLLGTDELFYGDLDEVNISENATNSKVTLGYESKLIRLKNKREYRYSNAVQQSEYPGDKGFEYLADIKNKRIYWGRPDLTRV